LLQLPSTMCALYIGIMSGTSLDGVDAALVSFDEASRATLIAASSVAFPPALRDEYLQLQSPSSNEIHRERLAANALALLYSDAVASVLQVRRLSVWCSSAQRAR
jgi:anhydro-N-acetylmuramic acid kinase